MMVSKFRFNKDNPAVRLEEQNLLIRY